MSEPGERKAFRGAASSRVRFAGVSGAGAGIWELRVGEAGGFDA